MTKAFKLSPNSPKGRQVLKQVARMGLTTSVNYTVAGNARKACGEEGSGSKEIKRPRVKPACPLGRAVITCYTAINKILHKFYHFFGGFLNAWRS